MQRSTGIFSSQVQKVVLPAATISEVYINAFLLFKSGILITCIETQSWSYHILPYSGLSCASPTQNVDLPTNVFEQEPVISGVWLFCAPFRSKFLLYRYILPSHFQGSFFSPLLSDCWIAFLFTVCNGKRLFTGLF